MTDSKLFNYHYINKNSDQELWLLHGTGADEFDLIPLAERFSAEHTLVSLRGNIQENGMNRFFARKSMGVFDQESIDLETGKLRRFIQSWRGEDDVVSQNQIFLGYSNGANMILATLFKYPDLVDQAILLHPMMPFEVDNLDLKDKRFMVSYGLRDQMITAEQSRKVISVLEQAGAEVSIVEHSGGHELRPGEVEGIVRFINS